MMRIIQMWVTIWIVVLFMGYGFPYVKNSLAESSLQQYERGELSFRYSSDLKMMSAASAEKIRNMLNTQMRSMGSAQSSIIALDVLLDLPAFRVLISKEHFIAEPTPQYLMKEKEYLFTEAKKRSSIISFGEIQEKTIAGYPAIEYTDIDKGVQGYGSNYTILCGVDTWNFSFIGSSRGNYEKRLDQVKYMMSSVTISGTCKRSDTVLS